MTKDKMIKYIMSFALHGERSNNQYAINMKIHSLPLRAGERDNLYTIIGDESLSSEFYQCLNDDIENWRWENKELLGVFTETKYWEGRGWLNLAVKEDRKSATETINAILKHNLTSESRKQFEEALKNKQNIYGAFKEYREQIQFTAGFGGRSGGWLELGRWNGHNYWSGWVHDKEELEEMSKEDVRGIYLILRAFEKLSEALIETARAYSHEEIKEETYTIEKKRKVFASNVE